MNEQQEPVSRGPEKKANGHSRKSLVIGVLVGMAAGAILCGGAILAAMPSMMIVTEESRLGFDETVSALEKSVAEHGWVVSTVMDMNKSMAKHGVEFGPRVKVVKLCNPEYAKSVLTTDRHVSTLMPCSLAVWEGDDGKVYLSKMNMGLMAKLFGGNIAEVMGEKVVKDERAMLSGIVKH
jgi:uncharacterized protein (DUF302 family)